MAAANTHKTNTYKKTRKNKKKHACNYKRKKRKKSTTNYKLKAKKRFFIFLRNIVRDFAAKINYLATSGMRYSGFSMYSSEGQSVMRSARERRCVGWFCCARRRWRKISMSGLQYVHCGVGGVDRSDVAELVEPLLDSCIAKHTARHSLPWYAIFIVTVSQSASQHHKHDSSNKNETKTSNNIHYTLPDNFTQTNSCQH